MMPLYLGVLLGYSLMFYILYWGVEGKWEGHCFSQKTWWNEWRSKVNSLWTTTFATGRDIMRRDIFPHLLVESPGYVLQELCAVCARTALWLNHQGSRASSGEQDGRAPEGIALRHRVADTAGGACLWQHTKDRLNPKPVFLLSWDFGFMAIKIKVKLIPGSVGLFFFLSVRLKEKSAERPGTGLKR